MNASLKILILKGELTEIFGDNKDSNLLGAKTFGLKNALFWKD